MGFTVRRKTAKNLAVRRKNERILTVSCYKILTVNRKSHYPIVTLLTVSRKKAKILTVNRKSHYPIETLFIHLGGERHCERKVSCPRTQRNDPGQGSNPGRSTRRRAH